MAESPARVCVQAAFSGSGSGVIYYVFRVCLRCVCFSPKKPRSNIVRGASAAKQVSFSAENSVNVGKKCRVKLCGCVS